MTDTHERYSRGVFEQIGLSVAAADELATMLDIMRPGGLDADDVADQIQRSEQKIWNTCHLPPPIRETLAPEQLHLFQTLLRR